MSAIRILGREAKHECVSVIYMTPSHRTQAAHKPGFRDGISPIAEQSVAAAG